MWWRMLGRRITNTLFRHWKKPLTFRVMRNIHDKVNTQLSLLFWIFWWIFWLLFLMGTISGVYLPGNGGNSSKVHRSCQPFFPSSIVGARCFSLQVMVLVRWLYIWNFFGAFVTIAERECFQPEYNSITFPAGVLHQPFFDENWPASLNYGALGTVAGHELVHGFDDEGVQWSGVGELVDWMTEQSAAGFQNMADCVVNEYNRFCPLVGTGKIPECVNGEQTQGENIADNGGNYNL